jgi:starvation-inducible DNA-binding protein
MDLKETLKTALADTFAMYWKALEFHWNVEGQNFSEYHAFFGSIYDELSDALDVLAEQIRMQKTYVPALERLLSIKTISVSTGPIDASAMMKTLVQDNKAVVNSLTTAYNTAEEAGEFGLSNILQDRISAHKKHGWMLESFTK